MGDGDFEVIDQKQPHERTDTHGRPELDRKEELCLPALSGPFYNSADHL